MTGLARLRRSLNSRCLWLASPLALAVLCCTGNNVSRRTPEDPASTTSHTVSEPQAQIPETGRTGENLATLATLSQSNASDFTMKLTLPERVVVGTPSPFIVNVTPVNAEPPLQVTFVVTEGDATLSAKPQDIVPSTRGEHSPTKIIVTTASGIAEVKLEAKKPGPITIRASSGSLTLEAIISAAAKTGTSSDHVNAPPPGPPSSMKLTLPNNLVMGTASTLLVHLAPESAETPLNVTFKVTQGDATLSSTQGESRPEFTVRTTSGNASVKVRPNKVGPITVLVTASSDSSTLETSISAVARPDPDAEERLQSEKLRSQYVSYLSIPLCLISLASILLIRSHTRHEIALAHGEISSLQSRVDTLSNQAGDLHSKLLQQQTEEKQTGTKAASKAQSVTPSSRSTKNPSPMAPAPASINTKRPVAGSQKDLKSATTTPSSEVAQAATLPGAPTQSVPMPAEVAVLPVNDPTGDALADYNRARAMSDPQGEDWFHRHYACRGLSCKNLDEWKLDPATRLVFEASSFGKFEALQDGTQTLVFPAFNVDYGPARDSLEGVFLYPEHSGDEVRLLSPAVVEGGGERWTLRKPGEFQHG